MSEYSCPVTLSSFQAYLKDLSSDATYQAILQSFLDDATSRIYHYLGRDYTASAAKEDKFWGTGSRLHLLSVPTADTIVSFHEYTLNGSNTTLDPTSLVIGPYNTLIWTSACFAPSRYYRVGYTLTSSPVVPDAVLLSIKSLAYRSFEESRRGLGSLGKQTDFSNVLGQSSLKYIDLWPELMKKLEPFVWYGGA